MADDVEDYVYYGTPVEREEDTSARKRKAVADSGQLRALPAWKQDVRDAEGRRRFHGAFTGGFSAGYYNSVGSKEGWTPQTFTSSRKNRAELKEQSISTFLDEEDIKDNGGHRLETSMLFDTFGFTAAEVARKQAEMEQQKRPSTIPGPVPEEILLPAASSVGIKLLQKMGWRHGRSISDASSGTLYDARREGRKAFLAFSSDYGGSRAYDGEFAKVESEFLEESSNRGEQVTQSTPVNVFKPKQDSYGLGYDPFKHAPEFRASAEGKRLRVSGNEGLGNISGTLSRRSLLSSKSGKYAPGFGIGALEELDYEDEDIYTSGFDFEEAVIEEDEPPKDVKSNTQNQKRNKNAFLSGFKLASNSDYNLERFHPPAIPPNFEPVHKFPIPLCLEDTLADAPPPEVLPPDDNNQKVLIEGFATLVARCGKVFEDLSKEKHQSNPLFSFLNGGHGHSYYSRRLWEEKQRRGDLRKKIDKESGQPMEKMTADGRGRILGEKSLERSSNKSVSSINNNESINIQSNLSDTFITPSSHIGLSKSVKPFKDDPVKQERFEQFLKDKYQGGLRSTHSGGNSKMSEADRARERLDFEAAAEAIEKGTWDTNDNFLSDSGMETMLFIASAELKKKVQQDEENINEKYPRREEFQWRPSPILCKRFDIIDPFMGKPAPLPRARSKMDTFIFMPDIDSIKHGDSGNSSPNARTDVKETQKGLPEAEPDIEPTLSIVQRPVDLYKAIFSDDSDDDEAGANLNQTHALDRKKEGANTTLNRLVAGDFLESLGKELGLELPPEVPNQMNAVITNVSMGDFTNRRTTENSTAVIHASDELLDSKVMGSEQRCSHNIRNSTTKNPPSISDKKDNPAFLGGISSFYSSREHSNLFNQAAEIQERETRRSEKPRNSSKRRRSRSRSSDTTDTSTQNRDVERSSAKGEHRSTGPRTHSRYNRSRSSDTDSSSDSGDRYHGRSREKRSSRSSKKHSKHHHREKGKRSPSRYFRYKKDTDDDKYRRHW